MWRNCVFVCAKNRLKHSYFQYPTFNGVNLRHLFNCGKEYLEMQDSKAQDSFFTQSEESWDPFKDENDELSQRRGEGWREGEKRWPGFWVKQVTRLRLMQPWNGKNFPSSIEFQRASYCLHVFKILPFVSENPLHHL